MRLLSRWRPCPFLLSLLIVLGSAVCGNGIPESIRMSRATPSILIIPPSSSRCLAVPQELCEEERELFATLQ